MKRDVRMSDKLIKTIIEKTLLLSSCFLLLSFQMGEMDYVSLLQSHGVLLALGLGTRFFNRDCYHYIGYVLKPSCALVRSAAELLREDLATDFHPNQGFSSDVEHSSKKENGVRKPYKNKHGFF